MLCGVKVLLSTPHKRPNSTTSLDRSPKKDKNTKKKQGGVLCSFVASRAHGGVRGRLGDVVSDVCGGDTEVWWWSRISGRDNRVAKFACFFGVVADLEFSGSRSVASLSALPEAICAQGIFGGLRSGRDQVQVGSECQAASGRRVVGGTCRVKGKYCCTPRSVRGTPGYILYQAEDSAFGTKKQSKIRLSSRTAATATAVGLSTYSSCRDCGLPYRSSFERSSVVFNCFVAGTIGAVRACLNV